MRRAEGAAGSERQRLAEDLDEATERLNAERAAQRLAVRRRPAAHDPQKLFGQWLMIFSCQNFRVYIIAS
jgi:hypothetical protein